MRTTIILAAMLIFAPAAYAQTEAPTQAPETSQTQAPTITKVEVVDIAELPAEAQTRITAAAAQSTEAELQSLRTSIDAHEMAAAALQAEGVSSESVIAATISPDGTLTLITREG